MAPHRPIGGHREDQVPQLSRLISKKKAKKVSERREGERGKKLESRPHVLRTCWVSSRVLVLGALNNKQTIVFRVFFFRQVMIILDWFRPLDRGSLRTPEGNLGHLWTLEPRRPVNRIGLLNVGSWVPGFLWAFLFLCGSQWLMMALMMDVPIDIRRRRFARPFSMWIELGPLLSPICHTYINYII